MSGIDIKWGEFALVFAVAIVSVVVLTTSWAGGIRLLAIARPDGAVTRQGAYAGAIVCFAIAVLAVLAGLWLVIPQLHPWFK